MIRWALPLLERDCVPDALIRWGIRRLLAERLDQEQRGGPEAIRTRFEQLIESLSSSPLAINTREANEQHYEVPTVFYQHVLGPHLKYSACCYPTPHTPLEEAERAMLEIVCTRAQLANGQDVLELGCGWGSFILYAAARYPGSRFTGVSNSATQRDHILGQARLRGLQNVAIRTCDVNDLHLDQSFDRIVSVEMFEHVRNYRILFERIAQWLKPSGSLFVHIFCHRDLAYPFEVDGDNDWMARHFFTGGLMPSASLFSRFQDHLRLCEQWAVDGRHYERTCNDWLIRMDQARIALLPVFAQAYGAKEARKWFAYWRIFFMSCAELFGYRNGTEWFVSHYRFERR